MTTGGEIEENENEEVEGWSTGQFTCAHFVMLHDEMIDGVELTFHRSWAESEY